MACSLPTAGNANIDVLSIVDPVADPREVSRSGDGVHYLTAGYEQGNITNRIAASDLQAIAGIAQPAPVTAATPVGDIHLPAGHPYLRPIVENPDNYIFLSNNSFRPASIAGSPVMSLCWHQQYQSQREGK